ncbi:unnamed protein product [Ophioblennius macclurei]
MSVEVERKFVCGADTPKILEQMGAVCVGEQEFRDEYFDTADFRLTLRDMWLRRRKGCWELKCPAAAAQLDASGDQQEAALCSRYKEVTDLAEIRRRVGEVVEVVEDEDGGDDDDESWLRSHKLACFADFTTARRSFALQEDGVRVDLDRADFGYHVGEIEVLVADGGDVRQATEKISRTAQKLGLPGVERIEGKMNVYLKRNRPEHYARLLAERVL